MKIAPCLSAVVAAMLLASSADAAELKVLTTGAMKETVLALLPEFERQSGHKVVVANDTAGGVTRRIEAGDMVDVVINTAGGFRDLTGKGKIAAGSGTDLAKVGVGVVVKEGAPLPDIGTVEAFKAALLKAKSVGYIDPARGGSSGIYVAGLLQRLGIADQVNAKAKLVPGGAVADYVARGEVEIGVHQISEILPVKGVTLVGPLPAEIQNYTTYAAGVSANAAQPEAAKAFVALLSGPLANPIYRSKGMEPAH